MNFGPFIALLLLVYIGACLIFKTSFVPELIQLIRVRRVWGKYRPRTADLYMHPLSRTQNDRLPARLHFKAEQMHKLAAQIPRKPISAVIERISAANDALYSQEVENQPRVATQKFWMAHGHLRDQLVA
jgi:hypothetical protein